MHGQTRAGLHRLAHRIIACVAALSNTLSRLGFHECLLQHFKDIFFELGLRHVINNLLFLSLLFLSLLFLSMLPERELFEAQLPQGLS